MEDKKNQLLIHIIIFGIFAILVFLLVVGNSSFGGP